MCGSLVRVMAPPDCTVLSWVRSLELSWLIVHVLCGGGGLRSLIEPVGLKVSDY